MNEDTGRTNWQMRRMMSELMVQMELNPLIERYSWFIPKGTGDTSNNNMPFNKLLTNPGGSSNPELTNIGLVYVHMGTCDQRVWALPGQRIAAKDFTKNNQADRVGTTGMVRSVGIRPNTDTASSNILEIHDFNNTDNMWVEYQIMLPEAKNYTLTLRYQTTASTNIRVSVNGDTPRTVTLNSSVWAATNVNLGNLTEGKHTIRLSVTSGNCALNWLQVD